jgi:hypothetical protein
MVLIDDLARAALARDALTLRSVAQTFLLQQLRISECAEPQTSDEKVRIVSAALIELLAMHQQVAPPPWARKIGGLDAPFFPVMASEKMRRLRHLCETESPEPLRRRNIFAPPTFLESA